MNSNLRKVLSMLALSLAWVTASPGIGSAFPGHGGPSGPSFAGPGSHLEHKLQSLDLPAETRDQILALIDASRATTRPLREQIEEKSVELRRLMQADELSETDVLARVDELGELMTEVRKEHIRTMLAVRPYLTEEQREQLRDSHEQRHDGDHVGRWRGGGEKPHG